MADAQKITPDTPSAAHAAMSGDWEMLRTVMGGTTAMRAAGSRFLPQYESETPAAFAARLARAVLTNHFEDAVKNVSAMPFSKPLSYESVGPDLEELLDDVDLKGNALHVFAAELFEDAVVAGLSYVFVDYPTGVTTPDGRKPTLKDVKDAGVRPYWIGIEAENMLACHYGIRNGILQIVNARILEETTEEPLPGVFTETVTRRVRELYFNEAGLPAWVLYRQSVNDKGEAIWIIEATGVFSISRLPLVPLVVGRKRRDGTVKPLFLDLAYKQVEHFQSASDQRNILTASRFPILACAGAKPVLPKDQSETKFAFGPYSLLYTEDAQGKWYWVEVTGNSLAAGQKDLEVLTDELRLMGLQPVVADTGSVTATARGIDEARQQSSVQKAALNLEDALNQAIAITEEWLGRADSAAACMVNRDFGLSLNAAAEVAELLKMRQSGEISRDTFWNEMRRRDVLGPQFDPDRERLALESEQPDLPPVTRPEDEQTGDV